MCESEWIVEYFLRITLSCLHLFVHHVRVCGKKKNSNKNFISSSGSYKKCIGCVKIQHKSNIKCAEQRQWQRQLQFHTPSTGFAQKYVFKFGYYIVATVSVCLFIVMFSILFGQCKQAFIQRKYLPCMVFCNRNSNVIYSQSRIPNMKRIFCFKNIFHMLSSCLLFHLNKTTTHYSII